MEGCPKFSSTLVWVYERAEVTTTLINVTLFPICRSSRRRGRTRASDIRFVKARHAVERNAKAGKALWRSIECGPKRLPVSSEPSNADLAF